MDNLEEIKRRLDLVEFVGKVVNLKKAGRNFIGNCPFHSEKTPSFVVSPERQIWHCFGACNEGGDLFKFIMKLENISFPEAISRLAEQAGIKLENRSFEDQNFKQKKELYILNNHALEFYSYILQKHQFGKKALDYLKKRGLNEKIIEHFNLGYAPNSWDSLLKFLLKKGFSKDMIFKAGLTVRSQSGGYYDRFRGRIVFPLKDINGNTLGFSGRTLEAKPKEAKYINTPETPIYHKRENLFALNLAKENIRQKKEILIMEGEMDVIMSHQNGYNQAVAIKGSALTEDHLRTIKRLTDHLIFALDMDKAGKEAAEKGIVLAEKYELQMEVVTFSDGKDPADLLKTHPEIFKKAYQNKSSVYDFILDKTLKEHPETDIYTKNKVIEQVLPFLKNIYNPVIQEYYLKKLSEKTAVRLELIQKSLFLLNRKNKLFASQSITNLSVKNKKSREESLEEYLLALLLQGAEPAWVIEQTFTILKPTDFYQKSTALFLEIALKTLKQSNTDFSANLLANIPAQLTESYDKSLLLQIAIEKIDFHKEIIRTLLEIKKFSLKRQIKNPNFEKTKEEVILYNELKAVEKRLQLL